MVRNRYRGDLKHDEVKPGPSSGNLGILSTNRYRGLEWETPILPVPLHSDTMSCRPLFFDDEKSWLLPIDVVNQKAQVRSAYLWWCVLSKTPMNATPVIRRMYLFEAGIRW